MYYFGLKLHAVAFRRKGTIPFPEMLILSAADENDSTVFKRECVGNLNNRDCLLYTSGATYIQVALRESNMTMGECPTETIESGEILEGDVDYETIETTPPEFPRGTQALDTE